MSHSHELKNGYTKTEFFYDTTGTLTSFVIGSQIGGVQGAIVGVLVAATFDVTKGAYQASKPGFLDGYNRFIDSAISNWMKYNIK